MRCRRNARAAGERAERLVRGKGKSEGESVIRHLSEEIKEPMTCFCLLAKKNHRISKPRQPSRSALAATHPEAARDGKRLRNRLLRRTNRQRIPNWQGKLVRGSRE